MENIAVDPSIRGSNIGGKLMTAYIGDSLNLILLEVEPPATDLVHSLPETCRMLFRLD
ncbi:hypothetical protein QJS35_27555 [Cohnella silvisoli]|uniref:GNAT family N-acetyltransferase n=1 Tax=Cohnella silvisoli TaxID=2873699 RepID=A0ABV1L2Z7_9BACL|nr:hypothetical protein [Cohnella silvisoli]